MAEGTRTIYNLSQIQTVQAVKICVRDGDRVGGGLGMIECVFNVLFLNQSDPSMTGPETKFRLQQSGQFVMLVSVKEANRHAAVLPDGSIKSALISAKEQDSQFGVRLIVSTLERTS